MDKIGFLLINLGTPDEPTTEKVKKYLKEFLMDPFVIDIPYPMRWFLVNQIILRTRPQLSAEAYKKIWTKSGSPLLIHTLDLARRVQQQMGGAYCVVPAMRYGSPSINSALVELNKSDVKKIFVLPLYPQYSMAATQSSIEKCVKEVKELKLTQEVEFLPPFYVNSAFIGSFKEVIQKTILEKRPERIIFSFHGLPERHVRKTDLTKTHCLSQKNCCDQMNEANRNCYRAQCFATARSLAIELGLSKAQYQVSFQSRLGRTPWIKPYTDFLYKELASQGVKRIAVVCPSFVADCLETLEEVAIRGRKDFLAVGGEELYFIPSINSQESWVRGVCDFLKQD